MPPRAHTKPEDFLPSLGTLELPSGKVIYVAEVGMYHVSLDQIAPVTWTYYKPSTGDVVNSIVYPPGFITDPIDNSFIAGNVAFVEIDGNDLTARAILDHNNFDVSVLEGLPSKDEMYADAQQQSDDANDAIDSEDDEWYDKILKGLRTTAIIGGSIWVGSKLLTSNKK